MKRSIAVLMLGVIVGCATFGVGGPQPQDQIDLESAGWLMFAEYERIKDDGLSDVDLARKLLEIGDKAVQVVGHISFISLLQSRISDATNDRVHPNLQIIYMLIMVYLDDEPDEVISFNVQSGA